MAERESTQKTVSEKLITLQSRMHGTSEEEIEEALSTPTTASVDEFVEVTHDFEETEPRRDYASTRTA